jgi:hypothetical protein
MAKQDAIQNTSLRMYNCRYLHPASYELSVEACSSDISNADWVQRKLKNIAPAVSQLGRLLPPKCAAKDNAAKTITASKRPSFEPIQHSKPI